MEKQKAIKGSASTVAAAANASGGQKGKRLLLGMGFGPDGFPDEAGLVPPGNRRSMTSWTVGMRGLQFKNGPKVADGRPTYNSLPVQRPDRRCNS